MNRWKMTFWEEQEKKTIIGELKKTGFPGRVQQKTLDWMVLERR